VGSPRRRLQEGNDVAAIVARSGNPELGISPGKPKSSQEEEIELHDNASKEEKDAKTRCRH
jgi:hypothetical protein